MDNNINGFGLCKLYGAREVAIAVGATPKALEQFLAPNGHGASLGGAINPGTGRKRMITGAGVLMVACVYRLSSVGFPQRFSVQLFGVLRDAFCAGKMPDEETVLSLSVIDEVLLHCWQKGEIISLADVGWTINCGQVARDAIWRLDGLHHG